MTEPAALDEIVAIRNRLVDQRQKARETASLTLRTIGMGLAAISYSFLFSTSVNQNLQEHRVFLFAASVAGVISICLDLIQTYAEHRAAQGTLDYLKECRSKGITPSAPDIENTRQQKGAKAGYRALLWRAFICLIGFAALLTGIAVSI